MGDSSDPGAIITADPVEIAPAALEPLTPQQFLAVRRALSRSPFYIDDSTYLRIKLTANEPNYQVAVGFRRANLAGGVQVNQFLVSTAADTNTHVFDFQLGEGLLYNVNVSGNGGPLVNSSVFAQVQLTNGQGATATVLASLVAGYVTGAQAFGWPGSPIRFSTDGQGTLVTRQVTQPGLQTEWSFTVPDNTRWKLQSIIARLNTDVTGGNRTVYFNITAPSGVSIWFCESPLQQPAIRSFNHEAGSGAQSFVAVNSDIGVSVFPTPFFLEAGAKITSITVNFAAADFYDNIELHFLEWLTVN